MLDQITNRLAYRYSEARKGFSSTPESDYIAAKDDIQKVLAGEKELFTLKWAMNEEDYTWLENRIKLIHGKCYSLNHDIMHLCERVNMEIENGNLRSAQEILEKVCETARVDMLLETNHGQ